MGIQELTRVLKLDYYMPSGQSHSSLYSSSFGARLTAKADEQLAMLR